MANEDLFDDELPTDDLREFMDVTDEDIMDAEPEDEIVDMGNDIPDDDR
jgi:hypothetical protein